MYVASPINHVCEVDSVLPDAVTDEESTEGEKLLFGITFNCDAGELFPCVTGDVIFFSE